MSDETGLFKLDPETAWRDWSDLSPAELAEADAARQRLHELAAKMGDLTEDQRKANEIKAAAAKLDVQHRARIKVDRDYSVEMFHESRRTANAGAVDIGGLLDSPPKAFEPRVWDPLGKDSSGSPQTVLMRMGQIGALAGPAKGGKTRIAVSLMNALLDPEGKTPFLGYYAVKPLERDQVVLHIALEEDESDLYAAWSPYLRGSARERADRILAVTYSGVTIDFLAPDIRDEVSADVYARLETLEKKAGHDLRVGAIVLDPLFAMAQGDYNKDPTLATAVFNDVLKRWCKDEFGAEVVLVLAHTSKSGGHVGGDASIYGSIGWASKMHFLWYVQTVDKANDDYRHFGAFRGRADTYAPRVPVYMMSEARGDEEDKWGQLEIEPSEMDTAAREAASGVAEGARKPSKSAVLREKLEGLLVEARGSAVMARTMIKTLTAEAARIEDAGLPVPFLYSKAAVSKALALLVERGFAEQEDVPDPDKPGHFTHGWKWTPSGLGSGSEASLMPPVRRTEAGAVDAATGEILEPAGESGAAPPRTPEMP